MVFVNRNTTLVKFKKTSTKLYVLFNDDYCQRDDMTAY